MLDFLVQKLVAAAKDPGDIIDTISEIAPFIIFAAIWLFAVIAKAAQGAKKARQGEQKPKRELPLLDFDDLIKTIKQRYAEAKEQASKAAEQKFVPPQPPMPPPVSVSRPKPTFTEQPAPAPIPVKPKYVPEPPLYEITIPAPPPSPPDVKVEIKPAIAPLDEKRPAELSVVADVSEKNPHPYLAEIEKQFIDPNSLRKIILYSEILGPPLCLRD
jgi:hypothetical protein